MQIVLLVGLQGSGKSTFYRTYHAATHVLVSKDWFRNNRRPQRRQMQLIEQALMEGRSVVVDNMNPTVEDRANHRARPEVGSRSVSHFLESLLREEVRRNGTAARLAPRPARWCECR
jgi:hypothetical protein